ncbi:hypothetical protein JCM8097_009141 [Rhodosporidiobolus ruineniae]
MSATATELASLPPIKRASSRTSIPRKPVPHDGSDDDAASSAYGHSARTGGRTELDREAGRQELASTPTSPTSSHVPRRTASTSSRDPYSSASPSAMTPHNPASLSRNVSTSSRPYPSSSYPPASAPATEEPPLHLASSPPHPAPPTGSSTAFPGLTSRPSLRSQRSSVAPESVFGTAPVGVIGKTKPREVIRVERDYSAGERVQFWSGWIWELDGRISPTDFQNTLNELNTVLASAHDPAKSCFDNCLAVLTLYISPHVVGTHYDREMRKFDRVLERANRDVFNPAGLNILSPRRNAYLFLEVEYY